MNKEEIYFCIAFIIVALIMLMYMLMIFAILAFISFSLLPLRIRILIEKWWRIKKIWWHNRKK